MDAHGRSAGGGETPASGRDRRAVDDLQSAVREAQSQNRAERRAKEIQAAARSPENLARTRARWRLAMCVPLLAATSWLTWMNLTGHGPFGMNPAARSAAAIDRTARATLYMVKQNIAAFRARSGRLPAALADVGFAAGEEWSYRVLEGDRFQLSYFGDGAPVTYDSAITPDSFFNGLLVPGHRQAVP
jgi:hypothetical protein